MRTPYWTWLRPIVWLLVLLLAFGCASATQPGETYPRTYVVGHRWVVFLREGVLCFQEDAYRAPGMDTPGEAIAACARRHE